MPRRKSSSNDALRSLVDRFVSQVLVLAESRVIARIAAALGDAAAPSSAPAQQRAAKARAAAPAPKAKAKAKVTRTCPVPGCGKPGRGPRFRWLCDQHKGMSREAWLALKDRKAPAKPAAGKRAATAAPKAGAVASKKPGPKHAPPKKASAPQKAASRRNGKAPSPVRVSPPPSTQRKTAAPPARKTVAPAAG